ncbi:unnamed protein product [Amoebophrya sp. A25]|nr:unnamed protein product [Amoebophrya sp. A25]|eukprot:GSA25T00027298001.1
MAVVAKAVEQEGYALEWADDVMKCNREIVMKAVEQNGVALQFAGGGLRGDAGVVMKAIENKSQALAYAAREILDGQGHREIFARAVERDGWALGFLAERGGNSAWVCDDRDIVLKAVQTDGSAIRCAAPALRKDREIAMAAVGQDGSALEWLDDALKRDKEIVTKAVAQDYGAARYAPCELLEDGYFFRLMRRLLT